MYNSLLNAVWKLGAPSLERIRSCPSNLLSLLKQWCYIGSMLCLGYLLGNPESCLVIHESIKIFGITLYLEIEFIGSPRLTYIWFNFL